MKNSVKQTKANDPDENLAKGKQQTEQNKPDDKRVKTVVPDNDSGKPGPPLEKPSDKN